jgi:hypothetical protein
MIWLQARDDAKDSAAADRAGSSAAVEALRTPSVSLRDAVARRAAAFKQQHFKADGPGAAAGLESEGLQELRQLCDQMAKDDTCVPALLEVGGIVAAASAWLCFGVAGAGVQCFVLLWYRCQMAIMAGKVGLVRVSWRRRVYLPGGK